MERLKCDPLESLLRIVKNKRLSFEVRMDAAKAAAPYCYPRLATVFMNAKVESHSTVSHLIEAAHKDPALALAMQELSLKLSEIDRDARRKPPEVIDVTPALPEPALPPGEDR